MVRSLGVILGVVLTGTITPAAAWRQEIPSGRAESIAVHPSGDVIAAGNFVSGAVTDLAVVRLAAGNGAEVWRAQLDGDQQFDYDYAVSVVVDGNGDVIAAGALAAAGAGFVVVKLNGATGAELWRASGTGFARAVAVDAAGDPIAAGRSDVDFVVRKFAGATGALLWEHSAPGTDPGTVDAEGAYDVALDALGNAIVAGTLENVDDDWVVMKLAAADGAEIWRRQIDDDPDEPDLDIARAVALDGAGDVVAAGSLGVDFAVLKLAGATGTELWRQTAGFTNSGFAEDLALDGAGDAVAVGALFRPGGGTGEWKFGALKVAGGTGATLWSREINTGGGGLPIAHGVAVDVAGDVAAAGVLETVRTASDFVVVKFAGGTGAELWRQTITDTFFSFDGADAVAYGPGGEVFAGGTVERGTQRGFTVVRLGGSDGAVGPVPGAKLIVRDRIGDPAARRILGILREQSVVAPPGGSVGDPTLSGAILRLVNEGTLEADALSLPSTGWVALGTPPGSRGYQYTDSSGAGGPCRRARVKRGLIKVNCLGSQAPIAFSLDEPAQGALTLSLQLGSADAQCARFGGDVRSDSGTSSPGPAGIFDARNAPSTLGTCP